jgi:heptosyltransferase III
MLPDAIDPISIHRVLVVKLRHHGDVLLTSPVFSVLKNHIPHAELDALVYAETADMLAGHPAIANVHTIGREWKRAGVFARLRREWRLLRTLRARDYDLLNHLTESARGATLAFLLGPHTAVARDYGPRRGWLWRAAFTHRYRIPAKPRHTVEIHLDALRRLGIYPHADERALTLVPGADAEEAVQAVLATHDLAPGSFIHVHPTSRWLFKCWEPEKYAALINALQERGERVVLTAAPTQTELQFLGGITVQLRKPVVNLAGKLSLKQLAALTARAKLFIGVDSVPMHIAAAMQTPVVTLFGPSGDLEWGPWQVRSRVVTSNHSCRPCGLDGCGNSKVSECLTTIPVQQVLTAVDQLLQT